MGSLLANASMPLKFWDEAFITTTYLINLLPSKILEFHTPIERLLRKNQTTNLFVFLAAHVGQTYGLTTLGSSPFGQLDVSSLDIAQFTKGSSALKYPLVACTYLAMLSLMKLFFPLKTCIKMLELS